MIEQLFFELIRIAIGTQDTLSRAPSSREWQQLFDMAKKQSLVGVCFAAVQRLPEDVRPPEMLYLTWMGMAAKIQQRNEIVTRQCVDLQKRLSAGGIASCILKGQGVASLYCEHLRGLRQSGDIDIYALGGFYQVMCVAQKIAPVGKYTYVHAELNVFEDTEVELHYRPSSQRNLLANGRFQKWVKTFDASKFETKDGITVPSLEFNRIYLLLHCYRHVIGAGIGLRQLMDYYFCLCNELMSEKEKQEATRLLKSFGIYKFAGAIMYVMQAIFKLDDKYLLCNPDCKEGEYFLKQTLIGGNFGRYDERVQAAGYSKTQWVRKLSMNLRYATHYTSDLLWAPIWKIYQFVWTIKHSNYEK